MNLGELKTRCAHETQDPSFRFADEEIVRSWLNEALVDFSWQTAILRATGTITIVVAKSLYTIASDSAPTITDCLYLLQAEWNSLEVGVVTDSWMQNNIDRMWHTADKTGPQIQYIVQDKDGYGKFRTYYIPETGFTPLTMTVWYAKEPDSLADNNDIPEIPTIYHPALIYYEKWKFFETTGPRQDFAKANAYKAQYDREVGKGMTFVSAGFNHAGPFYPQQREFGA